MDRNIPNIFRYLLSDQCVDESDIVKTDDGFFLANKSIASILASKNVLDFPDTSGERFDCSKFFDDWFLYAVEKEKTFTYSLLKFREQERDGQDGSPADGDAPGVTISFIAFDCEKLIACLADPTDDNRKNLNAEINRVVAYRGQRHHKTLKSYFSNPQSWGAYLVADRYTRYIASFAENGCLAVPEHYKKTVQQCSSCKNTPKRTRIPRFIDEINKAAGYIVCDHENIYLENREEPTAYEAAAILATHAGNTSVFSFAAEVEYHAKFLTTWAKIKIPFFGKSVYDSAIRADMTVDDKEFEGFAPFYKADSKIVKRQYELHKNRNF